MLTILTKNYLSFLYNPAKRYKSILLLLFAIPALMLSGCSATPSTSKNTASIEAESQSTFTQAIHAMKDGEKKRAKNLLITLINKQPNISNAHVNLGILFLQEKSFYEAENSFNEALKINPDNIYALNQAGILYRQQGSFSKSKSAYKKAININPDYAFAHLNIAILYDLYIYDYPKALEHYKKYQQITKEKDAKVAKWIIDLERRYKKSLLEK